MREAILNKAFKNNTPRWVVLCIDLYLILNTFVLAYLIRFNFTLNFDTDRLLYQAPIIVLVGLISFLSVGSYKGIIRHTGIRDALNIFMAVSIIAIFLITVVAINRAFKIQPEFTFPISIIIIHFLLNVIVLITSRFLFKFIYSIMISTVDKESKVLIYGAGDSGLIAYNALKDDKKHNFEILGFIDDNKSKIGKKINRVRVYKADEISQEFIDIKKIDELIISIQKIKSSKLMEIVDKFTQLSIKVKIVPPVKNWIDGDLNTKQIKNVRIEDLLGRKPIDIDNSLLKKEINGKVVLITGAAGSIGSEIARQVASYNYKQLILLDQAESPLYDLQQELIQVEKENFKVIVADVRGERRMTRIFEKYKPNLVFHAAAYKHVPLMEDNPYEAVNVNVIGTKILTELSISNGVDKFVMISTDKAVNPTNVMGATKRVAETYISCLKDISKTKFITTRFGNVLGSNGSVIPLFKKQIENGGPITVTHEEITRYFMTIPEACQLVLEAGSMGNGGEIYVFDMGESVKIFDLALNMIHLSGLSYPKDIDIKITGLRPGEKIYEELLGNGENTIPTYHKKIMIAKVKDQEISIVKQKIIELCDKNKTYTHNQIVQHIKEIVPEFISNNSRYSKLDIEKEKV